MRSAFALVKLCDTDFRSAPEQVINCRRLGCLPVHHSVATSTNGGPTILRPSGRLDAPGGRFLSGHFRVTVGMAPVGRKLRLLPPTIATPMP